MNILELDITYRDTGIPLSTETISSPEDVVCYMEGAFAQRPDQEQFWVILLDRQNHPLGRFFCTMGTVSSTSIHPREVFKTAILNAASSIILVHNHPSGDPSPSSGDLTVTSAIRRASSAIGIDMLDHIIIGHEAYDPCGQGYFSFLGEEQLN